MASRQMVPFFKGGVMTPEQYLALVTMHGTIMVFMVLTTAPQSGFGNYFLAHSDRRRGHGFPGPEHAFILDHVRFPAGDDCRVFVSGGAPIGGWTSYPPLSALGEIRWSRARACRRNAVGDRPGDLLCCVPDWAR
jgi:cytochrome c oxidase subunit I